MLIIIYNYENKHLNQQVICIICNMCTICDLVSVQFVPSERIIVQSEL